MPKISLLLQCALFFLGTLCQYTFAFTFPAHQLVTSKDQIISKILVRNSRVPGLNGSKLDDEVEETTKKYGFEAGLFKAFKSEGKESGASQAKELLKKYGSAYLVTSISFAIVSFSICYALVDNGVDVAALLEKVGITATQNTETAGTFAIAYAAHKAASPIRFPPTVALTPVVANLLGKSVEEEEEEK
mmetsp:Transcript_1002/g.1266  ORF Transcript_1002/g.1266 Transcript_1002/m.1266 type:complete len:189 (+) Transcript_1002:131-697(+)